MINNFEKIKSLLSFDTEQDYYFIQIFRRKKDNPNMTLGVERLKSYCIYSLQELKDLLPKIQIRCDESNARTYIRLNRQNATDVSLRCIETISKNLREGNFHKNRSVWDAESGRKGRKDFWMLDIDKEHIDCNNKIVFDIEEKLILHFADVRTDKKFFCRKISTKSGVHLIVPPFDTRVMQKINNQFSKNGLKGIDINKDCNTLLYCSN